MADPLDFDQIPAQETVVDNWGQPTPWYQALWQRLTDQIRAQIGRLDDTDAGFAAVQADILAAQADILATQNDLSDTIADLGAAVSDISDLQTFQTAAILELAGLTSDLGDLVTATDQAVFKLAGNAGVASASPNGSGDAAIFHNFGFNPGTIGACRAFPSGTGYFHVQMISVDASYLNVRLFDAAGVAITSGTWPVAYQVTVWPTSL